MSKNNFRVIIVGGGPVGLFAAHILGASKIDYVLLEKSSIITRDSGAQTFLQGSTLRVCQQLGLLQKIEALGTPMVYKEDRMMDGTICRRVEVDSLWKKNHGYPCVYVGRKDLLELLYENLPNKEYTVRTSAKMVDIKVRDDGVQVILDDRSSVEGSIVLGCDGVYSQTLRTALALAHKNGIFRRGLDPVRNCQSLYGVAMYNGPGEAGVLYENRSKGLGTQVAADSERVFFTLVKRLDEPRRDYTRYTDEEAHEYAKEFADTPIYADVPFKDLWKTAQWYILVDQETGLSDLWYHDRIVLAGDCVAKMESFAGLGLNVGVQQVVALVNGLKMLLDQQNEAPNTAALRQCFEAYKESTEKASKAAVDLTTKAVDGMTWPSVFSYVMDQYLFPLVGVRNIMHQAFSKDIISHGQLVSTLPKDGTKSGAVRWRYDCGQTV